MSIEAIARVLNLEMDDPSAKLVLIGIANHTGPTGQCYPSVRLLMRYSGLAESTVRQVIKRLEGDGYITVQRRTGTSSLYFLGPVLQPPQGGGPESGGGVVQQLDPNRKSNRKPNASDARAGLPDDWRPANFSKIETDYPGIDIEHQLALFVADNNSKGTVLADAEAAFAKWMLRTKDLKNVKPRPAAGSGGAPAREAPAAAAQRLEAQAVSQRVMGQVDNAAESFRMAAAAFFGIGHDHDARRCAALSREIARPDSWDAEQTETFIASTWGDQWKEPDDDAP